MRPNERIVRLADLLSELSDVNRNMELPGCRISLIGLLKGTSGRYNWRHTESSIWIFRITCFSDWTALNS